MSLVRSTGLQRCGASILGRLTVSLMSGIFSLPVEKPDHSSSMGFPELAGAPGSARGPRAAGAEDLGAHEETTKGGAIFRHDAEFFPSRETAVWQAPVRVTGADGFVSRWTPPGTETHRSRRRGAGTPPGSMDARGRRSTRIHCRARAEGRPPGEGRPRQGKASPHYGAERACVTTACGATAAPRCPRAASRQLARGTDSWRRGR
jgi:hypothetical protein